jgi:hypothetical protein
MTTGLKTHLLSTIALLTLACATAGALTATPALATGDASTAAGEACPNEALVGFSEALSECRGLEMVSAPYKAGEEPTVVAVSADGSHVINKSLGNYSGGENQSELGAPYVASRGASGWGSVALSASSTTFPAQGYLTASPDLSRSLWRFRSASEPLTGEDLYLREANGSFVKVGSFVPPADQQGPPAGDDVHFYGQATVEYQDASSDLSHVLFATLKYGPLWPFDPAIRVEGKRSSLYEYSGVGNTQPALIGVSDGRIVLKGFRSKPTEPGALEPVSEVLSTGSLISDCQTKLGAEEGEGYNAMSANGETVYFTAAGITSLQGHECKGELVKHGAQQGRGEVFGSAYAPAVNELFARVGGVETVPVSEPTFEECAECQTGVKTPAHEPVVEQGAEFAGASEDGSKAFFLTRQELLPGEVGMNLFEYDFDAAKGEHVLRVSGASGVNEANVLGVARVSEDGSHVYFVAEGEPLASNANRYGRTANPTEPNLYLFLRNAAHPTGEIVFITPLSHEDEHDWAKNDNLREFQVTPDGRFAVFVSRVDVASGGGVVEGSPQVFEFAAESGELVRVSTGQRGFGEGLANAEVAGAEMPTQNYLTSSKELGPTSAHMDLAVSEDGSTVAFSSQGALTESALAEAGVGVLSSPQETNAYVFYSVGGVLSSGEVHLVSARARHLVGLDTSGNDVFFETPGALLPSDVDGADDIYDARIDGGVPVTPTTALCAGEGCLGAPTVAPVLGPPSSASVTGAGNLAPARAVPVKSPPPPKPKAKAAPKKCRRGTTLVHGRCEKRKVSKSTHRKGSK